MHARMTLHWNIAHNTIPCVSPLLTYHTYVISPPHRTNPLPEAQPSVSLQTARQIRVLSCTCPILPAFHIIRDVIKFTITSLSNTPKRFACVKKCLKSRNAQLQYSKEQESIGGVGTDGREIKKTSRTDAMCISAIFYYVHLYWGQ